jgi:potassium-dependent mechanosensitive channel
MAWLVLVALALSAGSDVERCSGAEPPAPPGRLTPAIPLAEVARRADDAGEVLRAISTGLSQNARIDAIENSVAWRSRQLATRRERISVSDVVVFAFTVWAAFAVSALVRFVLEEDVFPRLRLSPGLPYALSSVAGYAIILVGCIIAALAAGVNLDRVTLLGGAFGVGVGFGLQNVVSNFVAGLVVLFERPVRVGDAVQIGDTQGEVRRIGIRAATVRSWQGAEIIVPNSMLVAEKVTNWTPADQQRRLEIPVSVAYRSAPDKVLNVLADVARAHPDVAAQPPPQALFLGFGDSALRFELWAWTYRLDRHVIIKSELGVALDAALHSAGMEIAVPRYVVTIPR